MGKVAVVLAGCGFQDGSEIHESVLCLLALEQAGHEAHCFAPNTSQAQVINHLTGKPVDEQRNCLVESARITRGAIQPLEELDSDLFDAILIPGGFGVATNLSNWAQKEEHCSVNADLKRAVLGFHKSGKPIGATCITPALLAKIFEDVNPVKLTLGSNQETNAKLAIMGMEGKVATVTEMVADEKNKVFTTPCYMEPPNLAGMYEGVKKVVDRLGEKGK